ncbi:hypothetical protein BDW69DRAFT_187210 [Aspergillus filifer]
MSINNCGITKKLFAIDVSESDNDLPQFPHLPRDDYEPSLTEQIAASVPTRARACTGQGLQDDKKISNIIQVAWAIVFAAQTNSSSVVYAMAYHGKTTKEGEQTIRSFEFEVDPDQTVKNALEEASDDAAEGVIKEEFQNLLVLEDKRRIDEGYGEPRRMEYSEEFPLTVLCEVLDDAINIQAMFDPEVIAGTEMKMVLRQFTDIFQMIISGSAATPTIHEMIEKQFEDTPDAAAVCAWDANLTYQELGEWSSRLAFNQERSKANCVGGFPRKRT